MFTKEKSEPPSWIYIRHSTWPVSKPLNFQLTFLNYWGPTWLVDKIKNEICFLICHRGDYHTLLFCKHINGLPKMCDQVATIIYQWFVHGNNYVMSWHWTQTKQWLCMARWTQANQTTLNPIRSLHWRFWTENQVSTTTATFSPNTIYFSNVSTSSIFD